MTGNVKHRKVVDEGKIQKERQKKSNLPTEEFWNRKQLSESCGFDNWISARDLHGKTNIRPGIK